ncbi:fatty-acyl-CoA synthase [Rhodoglobus vestalii]|uniref:Fatty-acyl-CoA synthase n=1 Tax=Rhodoglobus vestalii TaxID=193384 RepID=A0A8H2K587_9MICO|nr:long-chain fatty acid--CoA ligase [Rhodoglobus vestalii]TQO20053.1 fatty-acyl-CoA synthase [Rhodoglobus vestalii]
MLDEGIGSWTDRRARVDPQKIAIRFGEETYTYGQLHDRSIRLANVLKSLGIGRGDRVAYLGKNHPSLAEALFACGKLGAVFLPLNTRLAAPEYEYILNDAEPSVLIHESDFEEILREVASSVLPSTLISIGESEHSDYETRLKVASNDAPQVRVRLDDLCMIQYTSGTTGHPKGVMLTHGNITWNSINMMIDVDFSNDEVSLLPVPMFHTAGINNLFLTTILKGGTVVIMRSWNTEHAIDLIEKHRVTLLLGVPTIFQALAESARWTTADFSSLRSLPCGAAPLPLPLIERYAERGLKFLQGYGMTESSPNATFLREDKSVEKIGSAGTPCFFSDLRIVDTSGTDVAVGERGEILLQGPNVMSGYWRQAESTRNTLSDDGWLRTGDIAEQDEHGFVFIVDRIKDLIISGGENIYPAEIEGVLLRHPAIADSAVVGVFDARWGEAGHAFVVLHPGATVTSVELHEYARSNLAGYKVPRSFQTIGTLPRNATGKIMKVILRGLADVGDD